MTQAIKYYVIVVALQKHMVSENYLRMRISKTCICLSQGELLLEQTFLFTATARTWLKAFFLWMRQ